MNAVSFDGTTLGPDLTSPPELDLDTDYFIKITRTHVSDLLTIDIYTDGAMTQLLGSTSIADLGDDYKFFKYFIPYMCGDGSVNVTEYSGVIENYDLDPSCRMASTIKRHGGERYVASGRVWYKGRGPLVNPPLLG